MDKEKVHDKLVASEAEKKRKGFFRRLTGALAVNSTLRQGAYPSKNTFAPSLAEAAEVLRLSKLPVEEETAGEVDIMNATFDGLNDRRPDDEFSVQAAADLDDTPVDQAVKDSITGWAA